MTKKRLALLEAVTINFFGLLLTIFITQPVIFAWFGITVDEVQNLLIAVIFAGINIAWIFGWRLIFQTFFYKN